MATLLSGKIYRGKRAYVISNRQGNNKLPKNSAFLVVGRGRGGRAKPLQEKRRTCAGHLITGNIASKAPAVNTQLTSYTPAATNGKPQKQSKKTPQRNAGVIPRRRPTESRKNKAKKTPQRNAGVIPRRRPTESRKNKAKKMPQRNAGVIPRRRPTESRQSTPFFLKVREGFGGRAKTSFSEKRSFRSPPVSSPLPYSERALFLFTRNGLQLKPLRILMVSLSKFWSPVGMSMMAAASVVTERPRRS